MTRFVCVFCGSKAGAVPVYAEAARALGQAIASTGLGLVYGGAAQGLMGAVADAVLEGGGPVVGVIPHGLARQEFAHPRLTEAHTPLRSRTDTGGITRSRQQSSAPDDG